MLIYAKDVEAQLNEAFKKVRYDDHYKYYHYDVWFDLTITIENDTWKSIQMVSIDKEGEILGYLTASINRGANYISGITAIAFKKDSTIFARDFFRFLEKLFENGKFHKINFVAIEGNPANKMYEKIMERYGGRIVGIRRDHVKLPDGKLYGEIIYEIHYEDYVQSKGGKKHAVCIPC